MRPPCFGRADGTVAALKAALVPPAAALTVMQYMTPCGGRQSRLGWAPSIFGRRLPEWLLARNEPAMRGRADTRLLLDKFERALPAKWEEWREGLRL
jgi:hypothetical protein